MKWPYLENAGGFTPSRKRNSGQVRRLILRDEVYNGQETCDDLTKMDHIYRKLKSLEAPELFRPWAFRIASRAGLRHVKKRRRWSEHVQEQASLEDIPATNASFDEGSLQELLATNQISPGCSAVLTLHFEEQMSLAEVAEVLEIPLGTVKSRLAYGLAALRKRLSDRRND